MDLDFFDIISDLFQVRQLAAVELRKRVSSLWVQLPVEERDQIKSKLPEVILTEQKCAFPCFTLSFSELLLFLKM